MNCRSVAFEQSSAIEHSDGASADFFGASVDVSGDVMIVGAQGDDDNGVFAGYGSTLGFDAMTAS